jgi:hypothetical protein
MLGTLREAIEDLEIVPSSDELAEVLALQSRLESKVSAAVASFDTLKLWELDYQTSMGAWLRAHGHLTSRDAARTSGVAKRLRALPVTRAAWEQGSLSSGQIQAIVANVGRRHASLFSTHEGAIIPTLVSLSVAETAAAMQEWARRAKDDDEPDPELPERSLHLSSMLDGRFRLDGEFDAEGGSLLGVALRLAQSKDGETDEPRSPSQRRGDALVDLCRFFLDHQQTERGGRHRPHLNIVSSVEDIEANRGGHIVGGPAIDSTTLARLCCDSALHRVLMSGRSAILDYGTSTRTVPAPLWNALVLRDVHCRAPGCDRGPQWGEGHHVVHVPDGGETNLANLVLACSRHHHVWHLPGWHLKLLPDGELHLTAPDDRFFITRPPP